MSLRVASFCEFGDFQYNSLYIVDIPLPPEGPLKAENVTKSSCSLHWRPPKDDGGSEITHYAVEKLDTENMRWVPVGDVTGTSIR
jgi:hypothetical protein